jgi:hypothetical protein
MLQRPWCHSRYINSATYAIINIGENNGKSTTRTV